MRFPLEDPYGDLFVYKPFGPMTVAYPRYMGLGWGGVAEAAAASKAAAGGAAAAAQRGFWDYFGTGFTRAPRLFGRTYRSVVGAPWGKKWDAFSGSPLGIRFHQMFGSGWRTGVPYMAGVFTRLGGYPLAAYGAYRTIRGIADPYNRNAGYIGGGLGMLGLGLGLMYGPQLWKAYGKQATGLWGRIGGTISRIAPG